MHVALGLLKAAHEIEVRHLVQLRDLQLKYQAEERNLRDKLLDLRLNALEESGTSLIDALKKLKEGNDCQDTSQIFEMISTHLSRGRKIASAPKASSRKGAPKKSVRWDRRRK